MTFITTDFGIVSTVNSSILALAPAVIFTGVYENVSEISAGMKDPVIACRFHEGVAKG